MKNNKRQIGLFIIFFLLVISTNISIKTPYVKADGESWLTGWDYRKNHTIDMSEVILPLPSWSKYEGNPILNESGNETLVGFNSILKVDSVYHMYYSGYISGTWHVCHATSDDGKNWTKDTENNPLSGLSSAYCPMVWKEGAIWKMLVTQHWGTYGHYCIWYYTSPDGIEWTAQNEGDPVLLGTPEEWDGDTNVEGWGLMKIGNTYHLWYNRLDGPRQSGLATSTNLIDWTKNPNNPIFSDAGFYCQSPFKFGDYYYLLTTNPSGVIALYRDSNPTFYENDRVLLGTAIPKGGGGTWDAAIIDTPFIFCEGIDITRIIPSNTEVWCYYSANDAETITRIGMTIMPSMEESLSSGWMEGYQKRVIVHYGSGSDSGENTYLNEKCRTDFGDIRFTDDDKTTLLDCWMESKVDSDNAVFWLAVEDDLTLDNQTVYIYYGKADAVYPYLATELAHGEATFDAFDDYADESINEAKWTTTGTPTESGGVMTVGALDGIRGLTTFGLNYGLRFRANMKSPAGATYNQYGLANWDSDFNVAAPYEGLMQRSATVNLWTINTGGYVEDLGTDYQDVQRIWDINRKNVSAVHFWVDGIQLNVGTGHTSASLAPQFYDSGTVEGEGMVVDWVAIRKFVDPEPVHSSWGEEEEPSSNNAPNAPDLYSPSNATRFELSSSQMFYWNFSDPDGGDTQGAYEFELDNDSGFGSPDIDTGKVVSSNEYYNASLPASVDAWYWRVRTWDDGDLVGPWNSSAYVITDRINVTLNVPDTRIDISTSSNINKTGIYEYDSSAFEGTITLNDTETKGTVGNYSYTTSSISDPTHGISGFQSNDVWCVFDRVNITLSVPDSRINVGSSASIGSSSVYEYDGNNHSGTITLNETMIKNTVGNYSYMVSSITDINYGLTVFLSNDVWCVFDKQQLQTLEANNTTPIANQNVTIYTTAKSPFDNHALGSGDTLVLKDSDSNTYPMSWNGSHWTWVGSWASNGTITLNNYDSVNETTYVITTLDMNSLSLMITVGTEGGDGNGNGETTVTSASDTPLIVIVGLSTLFTYMGMRPKNLDEGLTASALAFLFWGASWGYWIIRYHGMDYGPLAWVFVAPFTVCLSMVWEHVTSEPDRKVRRYEW